MTQLRARVAAEALVDRIRLLEKKGASISLESCCCKEAIRVSGADITDVKIYDGPEGWEIKDV